MPLGPEPGTLTYWMIRIFLFESVPPSCLVMSRRNLKQSINSEVTGGRSRWLREAKPRLHGNKGQAPCFEAGPNPSGWDAMLAAVVHRAHARDYAASRGHSRCALAPRIFLLALSDRRGRSTTPWTPFGQAVPVCG